MYPEYKKNYLSLKNNSHNGGFIKVSDDNNIKNILKLAQRNKDLFNNDMQTKIDDYIKNNNYNKDNIKEVFNILSKSNEINYDIKHQINNIINNKNDNNIKKTVDEIVINRKLKNTEFTIYDIYHNKDNIMKSIENILYISKFDLDNENTIEILPNSIKFLKHIVNTKTDRFNFTNKNNMIYAFIENDIFLFMDIIKDILNKDNDNIILEKTIPLNKLIKENVLDINNSESSEKYLFNEIEKNFQINEYLYNKINKNTNLFNLIENYNKYYLYNIKNDLIMKYLLKNPYFILYDLLKKLNAFLSNMISFRNDLELINNIVHQISSFNISPEYTSDYNKYINMIIYMYIFHVIRKDSRLKINKIDVIDLITSPTYENTGYEFSSLLTNWMFNKSTIKDNYQLINEFDVEIKLSNKVYTFHTCGESATLNLLNYLLLDDN
jgi:hypothetical protein